MKKTKTKLLLCIFDIKNNNMLLLVTCRRELQIRLKRYDGLAINIRIIV